jgi:putative DNA primase/helicase
MAARMRIAILSITHFSKTGAATTTKALHRFIGSIAFVGAPRAAFAVIEHSSDSERRLLLHAKNNLAAPPQGLAFRLKQTIVGDLGKGIVASRVEWEQQPVTVTADEALAAEAAGAANTSSGVEAENFLQELLAEGPVPAKQVRADVEAAALSWSTVKRAKARLGIKAEKDGMDGGWSWSLPRRGSNLSEEDHVLSVSPFVPDEPLRQDANLRRAIRPTSVPRSQGADVTAFESPDETTER